MPEQVPFIDREQELALIDKLIKTWGALHILCIEAPGGIGKTRLLQEVHNRYISDKDSRLTITDIIDFDDHTFHNLQNVGRKIAKLLGEETFESYLNGLLDHRKMEIVGVSPERLTQASLEDNSNFIKCFNKISEQKRTVLPFDTTDALKGKDFGNFLVDVGSQLNNSLILVAGRNARNIGKFLQSELDESIVSVTDLPPLKEKTGEEYLQEKQELLHVVLEPELAQKLLLLSGGKPLLIDLAVEWRARGISLDWLVESSLEELKALADDKRGQYQQEFERQLVLPIAQILSQMDSLILLMSRVYPLDAEMIAELLNMTDDEAENLFKEAKTYAFVKFLPDGRITLHDEMRRMVDNYVWPEVDPEGDRRRRDSERVAENLKGKIQVLIREINKRITEEKDAHERKEFEAELKAFAEREALERDILTLKAQYLKHTLFVDLNKGIKDFTELFDEATQKNQFSFRGILLVEAQQYSDKLSFKQHYEFNSRKVRHLLDSDKYLETSRLVTEILGNPDITVEQRVNMLISRANAVCRLGRVNEGIPDFEEAVRISEDNKLSFLLIRAENGLGWAHRLTGDLERAQKHYQKARHLCWQEGGPDNKELREDYGWVSNNLTFVLSYLGQNRQNAINTARPNIEHWQSIGNDIGLGACYLVLGIAYYRSALSELAFEAFQKALDIFEPLNFNYWLGQIYSWRGTLYRDIGDMSKAKKDLRKSLEIGSSNIKAMTLHRLSHVYMDEGEWDLAEEYMKKCLKCAQQIPDFLYWLAAIARLTTIAAEKGEYQRLNEFDQMLKDYRKKIKIPLKNDMGIAYLGLARLALGQNDMNKIEAIVEFLRQGITLVIEAGSYAHEDPVGRLLLIEKDFHKIKPEIIRSVGQELIEYISKKEFEDVAYGLVTPIIYKWASWKGEKGTHA